MDDRLFKILNIVCELVFIFLKDWYMWEEKGVEIC